MRVLFVVQAYGREVFGGAESHCRMMATRMVARGHEVHVLTSCATTYYDWANHYDAGVEQLDGVTVHRLPVKKPRNHEFFGPLSGRVLAGHKPVPLFLQHYWIDEQGPELEDLPDWLWTNATEFDVVVFFTYLYYPTVRGLPMVSGRVPTVLHPLAHDEPPLYLSIFDSMFHCASGIAFNLEEEEALLNKRISTGALCSVIGIGSELDTTGDSDRFRKQYNLGDDPYAVCVGRLDSAKGSDELYDFFVAYKQRNPSPLKLVLVGEPVQKLEPHDDIVMTGFVEEQVKVDAVCGANVSIHPSYFESFSMALTEAWVQRRPALVNGRCDVLRGQSLRSNGAIPYEGFAEFEAALSAVMNNAQLAETIGKNGRSYVEVRYNWDHVMNRYEGFLQRVPKAPHLF